MRMGFGDREGGVWLTERKGNLNFIIAVETRNGGGGGGGGVLLLRFETCLQRLTQSHGKIRSKMVPRLGEGWM